MGKESEEEINLLKEKFVEKYKIDFNKLDAEQLKLSKQVIKKDDFDEIRLIAGCNTLSFQNKIIAAVSVLDENMNLVEEEYVIKKVTFPYIPSYLAYRELTALHECFKKLQEKADLYFINGNGILHPRYFGLASHFGVSINMPTIGVASELLCGQVNAGKNAEKVYANNKIIGETLQTKEGAKPVYVSIGHKISLKTSVKFVKKTTRDPHKLPEPLVKAHKYASNIKKEVFGV